MLSFLQKLTTNFIWDTVLFLLHLEIINLHISRNTRLWSISKCVTNIYKVSLKKEKHQFRNFRKEQKKKFPLKRIITTFMFKKYVLRKCFYHYTKTREEKKNCILKNLWLITPESFRKNKRMHQQLWGTFSTHNFPKKPRRKSTRLLIWFHDITKMQKQQQQQKKYRTQFLSWCWCSVVVPTHKIRRKKKLKHIAAW